jgi:beta-aspartyl-dipeptidase (metallo-type)
MNSKKPFEGARSVKLIKGGRVFAPDERGVQDILIINNRIVKMDSKISSRFAFDLEMEEVDATGKIICPGLVDSHLHLVGGGGASGFASRAKEISIEEIIRYGVTTVVGCLGIDHISKSVKTLLIKANALEAIGITAYIFTGSWLFPPITVTGSVEGDLVFIDKVIGVKLAVGEASSTHPDKRELRDLLGEIRRGALLGNKAGILHVHLGPHSQEWISLFQEILSEIKIPPSKIIFTHANCSQEILNLTLEYTHQGGAIDLTASLNPTEKPGSIRASEALKRIIEQGISLERITLTSDGNASRVLPSGEIIYIGVKPLFSEIKDLVVDHKVSLASALKPVTINPAKLYQLDTIKGSLAPGKEADLITLNDRFEICDVMAKGNWVMKNGELLVKDPV